MILITSRGSLYALSQYHLRCPQASLVHILSVAIFGRLIFLFTIPFAYTLYPPFSVFIFLCLPSLLTYKTNRAKTGGALGMDEWTEFCGQIDPKARAMPFLVEFDGMRLIVLLFVTRYILAATFLLFISPRSIPRIHRLLPATTGFSYPR